MADQLYGVEDDEALPKGRDNLFIWTVFILLLIGVAFACWLGSFYVFGHPEQPRAYKLLKKLGKIDPPRRFEDIAAPPGEFLSAQRLFERYTKFSRLELERENAELLRNYINNYRETKKLVTYMRGKFDILDSYELQKTDFFGSGVVALAQAIDFPQVVVEHVFPSPPATVGVVRKSLQTGFPLTIERTRDLSAVIHVEKVYDGRLQLTVVPLLYGSYALKGGVGTFSLEPPTDLNVAGGLPIVNKQTLQDAMKRFADYRRRNPAPLASADANPSTPATPSSPELVRLDALPEGTKAPATGALPEMPVATPIPAGPRALSGAQRGSPPLAMNSTPRTVPPPATIVPPGGTVPPTTTLSQPPQPPTTIPQATPLPRVSPQGVPLTPFIASNPAPGSRNLPGATWRTYAPGQAPRARTLTPGEAGALADRGDLGEKLYLRGRFVVTAAGENRAVLRPQSAGDEPGTPLPAATRVIVEYPGGAVPPNEGTTFARDDTRPLEIRDVRRGADGQINIYTREITQP